MMISVLIAGSYTPICLLVLGGRNGLILLAIVWAFAIAGILIKAFWVFCPKWVSSVLYIGMGWTCVLAFTQLLYARDVAGSKFSVYRKYKDKWILLKVQMHTSLRSGRHFRPLQTDERSHGFRNICAYC